MSKYIKTILLIVILCLSSFAGWMNIDSVNVKQKWRNKKLNTDALLFVRSADSLLDTANIYDKSGLIGINTSLPIDELTVGGALYLDGDAPQVYDPDWYGMLLSSANYGQMSGWKLSLGGWFDARSSLKFYPSSDSLPSGSDPRTLTYPNHTMALGPNGNVTIGASDPDTYYKLMVEGHGLYKDNLTIWDSLIVNGRSKFGDRINASGIITLEGVGGEGIALNRSNGSGYIKFADGSGVDNWVLYHSNLNNKLTMYSANSIDGIFSIGSYSTEHFILNTNTGEINTSGSLNVGTDITADSLNISGSSINRIGNIALGTNKINNTGGDVAGLSFNSADITTIINTPSVDGDASRGLYLNDNSAMAAGVGGGIAFGGKYTTAGAYSTLAGIKGVKTNAISTDYSGQLHFQTNKLGSTPATHMVLDESGNLGLGINSPSYNLDIRGSTASTVNIENSGTTDPKIILQTTAAQAFSIGLDNSDEDKFMIARGGSLDLPAITVRGGSSGYVGLGTATPEAQLHVNGTSIFEWPLTLRGSAEGLYLNRSGGSGYIKWQDGSSVDQWLITHFNTDNTLRAHSVGIDGQYIISRSYNSTPILYASTATSRVGIGTGDPRSQLTVYGAADAGPSTTYKGLFNTGTSTNVGIASGCYLASPYGCWIQSMDIRDGASNPYPLIIQPTGGNIGIGITAPSYPLEISRSNSQTFLATSCFSTTADHSATVLLQKSTSGSVGTLLETNNNDKLGRIQGMGVSTLNVARVSSQIAFEQDAAATSTRVPGRISFRTTDATSEVVERMQINSIGNVGIGTTTPDAILTIANGSDTVKINPKIYGCVGYALSELEATVYSLPGRAGASAVLRYPSFDASTPEGGCGVINIPADAEDTLYISLLTFNTAGGSGNFRFHIDYEVISDGYTMKSSGFSYFGSNHAVVSANVIDTTRMGRIPITDASRAIAFSLYREATDVADTYASDIVCPMMLVEYKIGRLGRGYNLLQ